MKCTCGARDCEECRPGQSTAEPAKEVRRLVRSTPDDELVLADSVFHMERMDDDHIWFQVAGHAFDLTVRQGKLLWVPQSGVWPTAEAGGQE